MGEFIRFSMHSKTKPIRSPRGKVHSILITSGEYEGWRCYGPYNRKKHGQYYEYYLLRKDEERKELAANDLQIEGMNQKLQNKPFLDFIR